MLNGDVTMPIYDNKISAEIGETGYYCDAESLEDQKGFATDFDSQSPIDYNKYDFDENLPF